MSTAATFSTVDIALTLAASGLSVIPIKPDASKSPTIAWADFQRRIATAEEIRAMFPPGLAVAIVAGEASGNLEVLDIESNAPFQEFCDLVCEHDSSLLSALPHVETPSGGHHLFYRCGEMAGNQKLAMRPDVSGKPEVTFETRGRGGYVLTIGCPSACHKDGREYRLVHGRLTQIPQISPEQGALLLDAARSFNRVPRKTQHADRKPSANGNGNGTRPGDVLNEKASWTEILEPHGWSAVNVRGEETLWRRPGKDFSFSATANYCGSDLLYVFSTNAHPFDHDTSYSKFAAFALLNHRGDYRAAARTIAEQFGMKATRQEHQPEGASSTSAEREQHVDNQPKTFEVPAHWKWLDVAKLRDSDCLPLRWNIQDLIAQGNFVIIAAETQTGKTLFGLFLAPSMLQDGTFFGKLQITRVDKILYLGLEDPDRRFKARLQDIEHQFTNIEEDSFIIHVAPSFSLTDEKMVEYLEYLITTNG